MKKYVLILLAFISILLSGCNYMSNVPQCSYFEPYVSADNDMCIVGFMQRAIEVDGMIPIVGMQHDNEGWVFAREMQPFWCFPAMQRFPAQISDECIVELYQIREAFIKKHGDVIQINVYDFDGINVIDVWYQPI